MLPLAGAAFSSVMLSLRAVYNFVLTTKLN
jgi:hypothetical protein